MALRGDLASVDLAQVFQMLALNKKVGLLSIHAAHSWRVLYFGPKGVTVHHNVHHLIDRVLASFVRTGRITAAAADEVREQGARSGQTTSDALLAGGYVEAAELDEQYRCELEEEIYDLFFCRDARFEFHEGVEHLEGRDGVVDPRFFFNCDSVIMEAARRIDEWTYISERIPSTGEVLVAAVEAIDADQFGADGAAVFALLDGRRNVAKVVELTGLSNFQVCKAMSQLLDAQVIAPVAAEELVPLAEQCLAENRLDDAIALYEKAIAENIGLPDTHSLAAAAYQAAERYEPAGQHLQREAEQRLAGGDAAGAVRKLAEVARLLPTDLRARQQLVELVLDRQAPAPSGFDAAAEGKLLVELLTDAGEQQRVRALLEKLLLAAPQDPDLKKALVNVHIKAGDQKRVVELYTSIADDLVRAGRPIEAISYLQKILVVDRSRADIAERVRELYEFDERSRRRSRALGALSVALGLLVVAGAGYWFYDQRASEAFERIDARAAIEAEDFAAAAALYEDWKAHHPLTSAVAKADAELQQIEAARQAVAARREAERVARQRELQKLRAEYQAEWQRHRQLFLDGQPEASLAALAKVRELVVKSQEKADLAWALEQQVEATHTRLTEFLAEAERLAAECERHLDAGQWQQARELSLRLQQEFEATAAAKRTPIPVWVATRPAGAGLQLAADGQPLRGENGAELRTPTLVLCPPGEGVLPLVATRAGFAAKPVEVRARDTASLDLVMEVTADRRISFPAPLQTAVGLAEGWLAVGLRGGRLGLSRTDGSALQVHELGGLRAVEGTPVVHGGRVFFATNENTVECLPLDRAVGSGPWSVAVPSGLATDLAVREGRVAAVDREFVLHCWEQAGGRPLWRVALDSAPSGPPTIERRQVHVGTADGRVLVFDASDGTPAAVLGGQVPITTRILPGRGEIYFGSSDGNVRAVSVADGKVLWTASAGRAVADGEIALADRVLITVDGNQGLQALDRETGKPLARVPLDGVLQRGLRVQGNRLLLTVRRPKGKAGAASDVLLALQIDTMELLWEYVEPEKASGTVGADELLVAWPSTSGEVVLFR